MTTLANPFVQSSDMQSSEDVMEVNSDLKGTMLMEEDIDFDLGDAADEHDEDSMMDDSNAAQQQLDADQQMDDDAQDVRDPDDEILDYTEDLSEDVEVPMTEDAPQVAAARNNGFSADSRALKSSTIGATANLSPPAQLPLTQTENTSTDRPEPTLQKTQQASPAHDAPDAPDPPDAIESVRTLYDEPTEPEPVPTPAPAPAPAPDHPKQGEKSDSAETVPDSGSQNKAPSVYEGDTNEAGIGKAATPPQIEQPQEPVDPTSLPTDVGRDGEVVPASSETHDEALLDAALNAAAKEHESEHSREATPVAFEAQKIKDEDQAESQEALVEPVGIVVTFRETEMSLFPPLDSHSTPETFLLPNDDCSGHPIRSLIDACANSLSDSVAEHEELELHIPALKLSFRRHMAESDHYSIRDMSDLHFQLHQNDGVEQPDSLRVTLRIQRCLSGFIDNLYTLAAEGKGLQSLDAQVDRLDVPAAAEIQEHVTGYAEDENNASNAKEDFPEEDDFDEPDLPDSEVELEEYDEFEDGNTQEAENTTETTAASDGVNALPAVKSRANQRDLADDENSSGVLDHPQPESEVAEPEMVNRADHVPDISEEQDQNIIQDSGERTAASLTATAHDDANSGTFHVPEDQSSFDDEDAVERTQAELIEEAAYDNGSSTVEPLPAANVGDDSLDPSTDEGQYFGEEFAATELAANQDEEEEELYLEVEEDVSETPQSLKRSRPSVDEVDEEAEAEADEGHQLKRTRSG